MLIGNSEPPVCEYFSAQPDLNVFTSTSHNDARINGASVTFDSLELPVLDASFECKHAKFVYNHTVANMIKLATDLSLNVLQEGQLLEYINIFGGIH